jgi:hypothetical protein
MPAASYDLYIEQGATFRFSMVYGHQDGTVDVNGNPNVVPYDLTNAKLRMQIRQRRGGEVLVAATTTNGGIIVETPSSGRFTMILTDEVTDSLTIKRAMYDLECQWPSGEVSRVLQGKVTISPAITQGADVENISSGLGPAFDVHEQNVDVDTLVNDQPTTA